MDQGPKTKAGVNDAAVRAKTRKGWDEWFAVLDEVGATEMSHQDIVAHLRQHHALSPWWQQMITGAYERERGQREKHEMPDGFQISSSKTIDVSLPRLYRAWVDEDIRDRWLPHSAIVVRRVTPGKSMRITWEDGKSSVDVNFYPKGENKSQVVLQHSKLPDSEAATRMKAFWAECLLRLKMRLES
jgi:uncharacterized protein YndB with AHSA1/START domain